MSLDGLWYIQSKIDAREAKGLQPIPYSRPETAQPSRDPLIQEPSKKSPLSNLKDDASIMTSSTSASTGSTMALLKEKTHRKKGKKENKKCTGTDAVFVDDRSIKGEKKKKKNGNISRRQSFYGIVDLVD